MCIRDRCIVCVIMLVMGIFPEGTFMENMIEVIRKEFKEECDYIKEANKLEMYRKMLENDKNYYVPKVYKEHSNDKCLCMEFAEGIPIDKFVDSGVPQELRNYLGELLLRLALKEIFLFRFMQTDPNPANFFYDTKKNQLVLIDLGAGRTFEKEFTVNYAQLVHSAANRNEELIIEYSKKTKVLSGEENKKTLDAYMKMSLALGEAFNKEADPYYDFSTQEATEKVRNSIDVDI
eukprot:TRINITY_DN1451_c0_g1_i6.p1 TRINITY_DN1451_c0_g1~~TRINITY_DN1451_c0_g1_i6.p1  ORF type:complete len:234 (-),score=56.61 TRINITY_DN1451_c0_g1_i6:233-934(-)